MPAIVSNPKNETERPQKSSMIDHSSRLSETLASSRKPGEIIRVKRISPWNYRVNYLTLQTSGRDIHLNSYHITRSSFLFVNEVDGQLVIEDRTR